MADLSQKATDGRLSFVKYVTENKKFLETEYVTEKKTYLFIKKH